MLGLIVRGIFLIGVLTWYSTSVWKMIDGYFRDQFRSYLEEEYRKNPRMRSDVADAVGKAVPGATTPRPDATLAPPRQILEAAETVSRAVEAAENVSVGTSDGTRVTGGTSENEAAGESTDKNAFLGTVAESGLESRKSSENEQDSRQPINHDGRDLERRENDDHHRSVSAVSKSPPKRNKYDRRQRAPRDISRENQSPRRRNVKTITLTERDFKSVIRDQVSNDDFWEFEEDADQKEPIEGILVSQLPYKPRADIGDLDRVTAEEYCPLNLEDEASCDQTYKWP
ncbi:hypothetical protein WN48_05175 [Eufriesea mexicana]|uniref:Uncharacterized protein n=1 Tax=Eufriesea mexicana TaxID=516756 RepID=A0A310S9H2_9HYME|nr:PREDICTED: uncharacterized protein LOC108550682 [Eufriesea mexicana]OAD55300.1 hypothetical protein WN48_05175 [Eufriesea mexicana]